MIRITLDNHKTDELLELTYDAESGDILSMYGGHDEKSIIKELMNTLAKRLKE